ncbi:phosphatase PAP2 family protein [Hydrogenophaga crassostreae]|nr:phosphatase PAP2 family protein [Hydrogenophaga crassostreae]
MELSLPLSASHFRVSAGVRSLVSAWLMLLAATVGWDLLGLDMAVMLHIGTPTGFPLQDNWWLSTVLHDKLRLVAQLLFVVMLVWASWPMRTGGLPRRERWLLVGLVVASLLVVNLIKLNSRTSCPWDLHAFGGDARYVSHWLLNVGDGGGGRCFPGGHASSAFAFFALCLPWLCPPSGSQRSRAPGWRWLFLVLTVGLVAGVTQTLRGAHHPSHTLWTLVICMGISIVGWAIGQRWLQARPQASAQAGKP